MLLLRTSRGVDPGIPLLRSLGSNAHVWLPGASGVSVASLPSNNYLLSAGSTGYSTVDGVDGLTLDAMGALSSTNLVTNGTFDTVTTGWTGYQSTLSVVSAALRVTSTAVGFCSAYQTVATVAGKTYALYVGSGTSVQTATVTVYDSSIASVAIVNAVFGSTVYFVAPDTNVTINLILSSTGIGQTADFDNISCKEYTGTHLTQATTANKPLVRRGMLCLPTYSDTIANAAWAKYQCSVSGALITATASGYPSISQAVTTTSGAPYTLAAIVSPGNQNTACLELRGAGIMPDAIFNASTGAFVSGSGSSVSVGSGRYLAAINKTATAASSTAIVGVGTLLSGGTINVHAIMIAPGTWTAAQILAEGGIPTTTGTAASNPSAGKYWWSFDGSNDSLLSGNLGITNACTIVVAGRVNTLGVQSILCEDVNGIVLYFDAAGKIVVSKVGVGVAVLTASGLIVAGVPFVVTARLLSGVFVIRLNGVQVATASPGLVFSATTGARIGTTFDAVSSPFGGALGWVVPLPTALSDADCLTVERLVAAQFPGMATF